MMGHLQIFGQTGKIGMISTFYLHFKYDFCGKTDLDSFSTFFFFFCLYQNTGLCFTVLANVFNKYQRLSSARVLVMCQYDNNLHNLPLAIFITLFISLIYIILDS